MEMNYEQQIAKLKGLINSADAIVIGAGAGLSTSAGFVYSGERFEKYFSDFSKKYGFKDMYSGGFYPYDTPEEFWAYWSRYIFVNRYLNAPKPIYENILALVKDKNYFVITTNVDHCFQKAGFDKKRLFYTQGDYGLFQCSTPCSDDTYDNQEMIMRMLNEQTDMKIPTDLIPVCPKCGQPLTTNLRSDDRFVQDKGWYAAYKRYEQFIKKHSEDKVLYLELGVGGNTPVIIKYPFWRLTAHNKNATYVCINYGEAICPDDISRQSICINEDIGKVIDDINATE
jgi:NAD-dependent SIR2 family protein deacetylase